jgi:hypothetical protein
MELLDIGIYNEWIDKSIVKLASLLPARYAKTEQGSNVITLIQPDASAKSAADNNISGKNKQKDEQQLDNQQVENKQQADEGQDEQNNSSASELETEQEIAGG